MSERIKVKWIIFYLSEIYYDSHCIILPMIVLGPYYLGFYRAELAELN